MPSTTEYEDCTDCCRCSGDCQPSCGTVDAQVTLSGFSDNSCTDCDLINATHTMTVSTTCQWSKSGIGCNGSLVLFYDCNPNLLRLRFVVQTGPGTSVDAAVWEGTPTLPFDCDANVSLDLVSTTGSTCSGYDDPVTVSFV